MDKKSKGRGLIVAAIVALAAGAVFLAIAGGMEDSWEYYFDESRQDAAKIFKIGGWLGIIGGVVDLIQGMVFLNSNEQMYTAEPVFECFEGEVSKKEKDPNDPPNVEWVYLRQKNGNIVKLSHDIMDGVAIEHGTRCMVKARDREIIQCVPNQ